MKKVKINFNLFLIGSVLLIFSGCYYRDHDEGYRKDHDHQVDNRGHDDQEVCRDDKHGHRDRQN